MEKRTVYFVKFWAPGTFVGESWTRDIPSLDPYTIKWPDNAYAFTLNKREDVVDGETRYVGTAEQVGPTYYHPDTVVETIEQARKNPNASHILISNMEINKWEHIAWSRWGNWPQPFDPAKAEVLRKAA